MGKEAFTLQRYSVDKLFEFLLVPSHAIVDFSDGFLHVVFGTLDFRHVLRYISPHDIEPAIPSIGRP
jgi:hypothetical protein